MDGKYYNTGALVFGSDSAGIFLADEAEEAAVRMLKDGLTVGQIANYLPVLTVVRLKELEKETEVIYG